MIESKKPLLKWPGGKRFLAGRLANALDRARYNRYFEPFAGGAALFFALSPSRASLSDTNSDLINLYQVVRDDPHRLIALLRTKSYRNDFDTYYEMRATEPITSLRRAARLYYLMRLSFNGIYRENLDGAFNVPYGHKIHSASFDAEAIASASRLLKTTSITACDFRTAAKHIADNDLVYFDPPYTTTHNSNGFIKYNRKLFSFSDQIELASLAMSLVDRGAIVLVSNADHPAVTKLYDSRFTKIPIRRSSIIAATSKHRRTITEALFTSENITQIIEEELCS